MTEENKTPEELIDRYLLGQATAKDVDVLSELLAKDEQLRECYRFRVALEGGYREAAIRGGEGVEPLVEVASNVTRPEQFNRQDFVFGFAVAAATLVAVAVVCVSLCSLLDQEKPTSPISVNAGVPLARLVTSIDATWRDFDPVRGAFLEKGNFQLEAGVVELEFNRGARITLRGPSSFNLKSTDLMHVSSGNLVAKIPEEAIGFTIETDEASVVDLGTEFGLRVGESGQTEVHVIQGLVEVFERRSPAQRSSGSIRVEEGQAIRLDTSTPVETQNIPVRSRRGVLGSQERNDLGLTFLQGNIRLKEAVSRADLKRRKTSWIEVIPEKSNVLLNQNLPVTLDAPGNYRVFGDSGQLIQSGVRVDSYLIHFRSAQPSPVQGVIKFDREIVGLVCEAGQLAVSDAAVGRDGVSFPIASKQYRGLEPRVRFENPNLDKGGGWTPDEVTLSQDMKTVGLRVNVNPHQGVDQLRVLVRSGD